MVFITTLLPLMQFNLFLPMSSSITIYTISLAADIIVHNSLIACLLSLGELVLIVRHHHLILSLQLCDTRNNFYVLLCLLLVKSEHISIFYFLCWFYLEKLSIFEWVSIMFYFNYEYEFWGPIITYLASLKAIFYHWKLINKQFPTDLAKMNKWKIEITFL